MKESRFVKTKIAAGYLLLVVVCLLSVGYVYRTTVRFSTPAGSYALLQTKRSLVSQVLYHLYRAEGFGQLMLADNPAYEERHRQELLCARRYIDTLRSLPGGTDTLQPMRLDSIVRLLDDKRQRTAELQRAIRSAADGRLLEKNIHKITGPRASVLPETFDIGSLFGRDNLLAPDARPGSVRKTDPARILVQDTITLLLQALRDSIATERTQIHSRAWRESLRLRYSNELIDRSVYRLLLDYETEETDYLVGRIRQNELLRRRSAHILGAIAVAAVLLMLCFVAILWRDINRSNRYRRALEQANRDKETLLRSREQLMLAITHDIKAPLGSMMGYVDLLVSLAPDRRQERYLRNMRRSSEHLLALVDSLLDFHRLDLRKVEVREVNFSPARLFDAIRSEFAAAAAAKGLEFRLELGPEARRQVCGDAFRIRQIADNLVSNALKFTDRGSVTLRADVVRGRLVFSVADTGRGIAPEERDRIFSEFVRLDSAREVEGFGLGLSIVDRLVKLLQGSIALDSLPGRGSKFIVTLPVGEVRMPRPTSPAAGLRALAIDDDPLQGKLITAVCRRAGIGAVYCQQPEKAVRLVAEEHFDVVLTDIQMPSMDGFALLERIRQHAPELPVIAVSARGDLHDAARSFAAVLRKPFSAEELTAAIAAVCRTSTPEPSAPDIVPAADAPTSEVPASESAPVIDFGPLTAFAGDDAEAARAILRSFVEEHTAARSDLRQAFEARDTGRLQTLAHRMLPVFTMLHADAVVTVLRRAERTPRELGEEELLAALEKIDGIIAEAQKKVTLRHGTDSDR